MAGRPRPDLCRKCSLQQACAQDFKQTPRTRLASTVSSEERSSEQAAAWRRHRLERELRHVGVDPAILGLGHPLHASMSSVRPMVEVFLMPAGPWELAAAGLPGQARSVAAAVYDAVQAGAAPIASREHWPPLGKRAPLTVVLEEGLGALEVGLLLRTCDAARVAKVVLCGQTPGPSSNAQVLKTSLSAEKEVPSERSVSALCAAERLRSTGHALWGLAGAQHAKARYSQAVFAGQTSPPPQPLALVLGGGSCGAASAGVLADCNNCLKIPLKGPAEASLSPAVAGSIAIFDIVRQWGL